MTIRVSQQRLKLGRPWPSDYEPNRLHYATTACFVSFLAVPLVSRMLPSDICRIWKRGSSIRLLIVGLVLCKSRIGVFCISFCSLKWFLCIFRQILNRLHCILISTVLFLVVCTCFELEAFMTDQSIEKSWLNESIFGQLHIVEIQLEIQQIQIQLNLNLNLIQIQLIVEIRILYIWEILELTSTVQWFWVQELQSNGLCFFPGASSYSLSLSTQLRLLFDFNGR